MKSAIFLLCFLAISGSIVHVTGDETTRKLLQALDFGSTIKPLIRPVEKYNESLEVKLSITLNEIGSLNFDENSLTTNVWISLSWKDATSEWNPSDFDGITQIHIPPSLIWTPDVTIYNMYETDVNVADSMDKVLTLIKNDGTVTWIIPRILKTSCALNVNQEKQRCAIKFGSWTHDGFEIDLQLMDANSTDGIDLSSLIPSNTWDIPSSGASRNSIIYACCPQPYVDVTFYMDFVPKTKTGERTSGLFGALPKMPSISLPWQ